MNYRVRDAEGPPLEPTPAYPHQWDTCPACEGQDVTWRRSLRDFDPRNPDHPGFQCESCGHTYRWPLEAT